VDHAQFLKFKIYFYDLTDSRCVKWVEELEDCWVSPQEWISGYIHKSILSWESAQHRKGKYALLFRNALDW
jgi:hypothetical protein